MIVWKHKTKDGVGLQLMAERSGWRASCIDDSETRPLTVSLFFYKIVPAVEWLREFSKNKHLGELPGLPDIDTKSTYQEKAAVMLAGLLQARVAAEALGMDTTQIEKLLEQAVEIHGGIEE